MAHRTPRSSYEKLTGRLNLYTQGASPAKLLYRIITPVKRTLASEQIGSRYLGALCAHYDAGTNT
ncbi:MAG: hypothetical protein ACSLFC_04565 [Desulfuromonadales bacterium]